MISILNYSPSEVQQKVFGFFNVNASDIFTITRGHKHLADIRKIYVYCLWRFTKMGIVEIGKHIGRNHTMVTWHVNAVNERCKTDDDFRNEIIKIESLFD